MSIPDFIRWVENNIDQQADSPASAEVIRTGLQPQVDVEDSIKNKELKVLSLGTVKVLSQKEEVEVTKDYQFSCKVDGRFSIDVDEMKQAYEKYLKKEKVVSQIFEATGYSEEG